MLQESEWHHKRMNKLPFARALSRMSLLAVVGGTLLSSCNAGDKAGSSALVEMVATDSNTNTTFTYKAESNFTPLPIELPEADQTDSEKEALKALNELRQTGGTCPDGQVYKGSPAIRFEGHLHKSALSYANWLQQSKYIMTSPAKDHMADGHKPVERMTAAGYKPARSVTFAESLALIDSQDTVIDLIEAWKKSPAHCNILFDSNLTWGSVSHSRNKAVGGGFYWVLNVASF